MTTIDAPFARQFPHRPHASMNAHDPEALPDVHVELLHDPYLSLDGTGAAARLRIRGTMTGSLTPPGFAPTGGVLPFETAEFSRFRDGLLAHHTVVPDMLAASVGVCSSPS